MRKFAKKHGIELTKEMKKEARKFFKSIDADKDGEIDLEEMGAAW